LVFIRRLEMRGFKSFGDRKVSVALDRGLTVVTGPNGSGKSNIFDAIRFTLGDLSARSLRADKMSEVIFDGPQSSSGRTAYVSIQLDNADRSIPVDTEAVTIARRVNAAGESDYFLNGKQAARNQLVDILSMAGLSSNGYNMIVQGTITRLADVTPEERRKTIEELVGISEYDAKKADARIQLQQAETNLKIAEARLGDVQARLERLEEERNDALRHNFIQSEMKKLLAVQLSHRISLIIGDEEQLGEALKVKLQEAENVTRQREALLAEQNQMEAKRRKFDEEIADRGNTRLGEVQKIVGDIMARMTACRMEIESGSTELRGLVQARKERLMQKVNLEKRLSEAKENLPKLRKERDELKKLLDEKSSTYQGVSSKLLETKKNFSALTNRISELEDHLGRFSRTVSRLDANIKSNETRRQLTEDSLRSLQEKAKSYDETLNNLHDNIGQLQAVYDESKKTTSEMADIVDRNWRKRERLTTEVSEGQKTARFAREAVVEFEAQRNVAEKFLSEEAALQRIEEMVQEGALLGVHGRLANLVSIEPKYKRALDVASAGWLRALVVEDATIALRCIETLKTMRLSPLKLIPLADLEEVEETVPPKLDGVAGKASSFVHCKPEHEPAVRFIFGDTVITSSEKTAFILSRSGQRAVDVKGDLYEANGGIVAGFYRAPIELLSLVPSRRALNGLSQSVTALEGIMERRGKEIDELEADQTRLAEEKARHEQLVSSAEGSIKSTLHNIEQITENAKTLRTRVKRLQEDLARGEETQAKLRVELEEQRGNLIKVAQERRGLRQQNRPENLGRYEVEHAQLNNDVSDLQRKFTRVEADLKNLEDAIVTRLRPDYETAMASIRSIDGQISSFETRVSKAAESLKEFDRQLTEFNKTKDELSESLSSVKERRRDFEMEFDRVEAQLRKVEQAYEPLNSEAHRLELEIQSKKSEDGHLREELRNLGYPQLMKVSAADTAQAEEIMNEVQAELTSLGSVNQLAISQYGEQQEKYKQLSVRRNQLELEKKAIVGFMEEIEQKKRSTFMQAFNSINQSFAKFFSRLTDGGEASLRLQNMEDPFAGGIDIFVQFPKKGARLIASASGGEKSVTAVSFIFAIQSLSPAPFYIFDEIDAHLDPYNTERLADVLKEQAAYSQLIVITLRDVVMDRGDRLFGVYIQDGASRVISTKLAEAAAG
jgi:chromosome segregation protein